MAKPFNTSFRTDYFDFSRLFLPFGRIDLTTPNSQCLIRSRSLRLDDTLLVVAAISTRR